MITNVMISRVTNPVLQEKVPLKKVTMEALLSSEKSLNACNQLLLVRGDTTEAEQYLQNSLTAFGMCIAMLAMGTDSDEFLKSPEGQLYQRVGIAMKVPAPTGEVREIAEKLQALRAEFVIHAEGLANAHRQRIQYSFDYN